MGKNERKRVAGVMRRSHERTDKLLERALSTVGSVFEPFERLEESPEEPPLPPPLSIPEPRRRTR